MKVNEILNYVLANNLSAFTQKTFETVSPNSHYLHNWHIDAIADYLEAVTRGEIIDLIINMPPRFMKSISVSVAWSAFLLGRDPKTEIICASYSAGLSADLSMKARNVVESEWFGNVFPDFEMARDQNQKSWFKTKQGGGRFAPSVGGTITGMGGDYLILDDPVNPEQSNSVAELSNANSWIETSFMSRRNNHRGENRSRLVLVMQRLHENDPTGRLLDRFPEIEKLELPAYFEKKTVISTPKNIYELDRGEFLHDERFGQQEYDKTLSLLGSYAFAGQYLQRPTPADGGILKKSWYRFYDEKPNHCAAIIHSWDTALSANAGSDYSVCTVWGVSQNGYYLLDIFRKRLEFPELLSNFKRLSTRDLPDWILIEAKGSGLSLIQTARETTRSPIIEIVPVRDKVTRLSAVTPFFESGKIFFPKDHELIDNLLNEMDMFPNGKNDDIVDTISQFLGFVRGKEQALVSKFSDVEGFLTVGMGGNSDINKTGDFLY